MELPTQVIKSKTVNPSLLTVFGQSKVGKTTMLSKLNNCLIIDTEKGTRYVDALKVHVNNSTELKEVVKALKGDEGTVYDYLALDTIDNVVSWFEKDVARDNNVDSFAKIPFGDGYNQVRTRVMNMITALMDCCDHVIIIGHRKKTIIGNESVEVNVSSLDLFEASDEIEAGTRLPHLAGKILDFKWSEIYKTAVGK